MEEDDVQAHKPAKLLVIDDTGGSSLLKRRLAMYGHEVTVTKNSAEAMKILQGRPVDVIFLNMFLGGESSYDFLVQLKSDLKVRSIPVIMISSDENTELLVKCIEAGAEDYLVRPLNQTILKARLSNCISRKEAHDKEAAYIAKIQQGQKQIAAQEKMASVGVLASSISQELKSPLNFVINFAHVSEEICEELLEKLENEKVFNNEIQMTILENLKKFQSNIGKISQHGINADRIIRFMLDQASVDNSKKHPASINKIITQTINMLFSSYKSKGITNLPQIVTNLDNAVPHILLSVQAFSKVIYNMLDNSVHAVTAKFEELSKAEITVRVINRLNDIEITIKDNGIGIKEDIRKKIFEPFFTTKDGGMNPGLGLSTALEIVQDLNGSISVNSEEGQFSEFKIVIPKNK